MTLRQISEIVGLPIVELETGDILGQVASWVVSIKDQRVLAFVLKKDSLLGKPRVALCLDILEYAPRMLVVRDVDSIINPKEVVGLSEATRHNETLVGYPALDEAEKALGRVSDFVFDITDGRIQQYYITPGKLVGLLYNDLVLNHSQVIRVAAHGIVFSTNNEAKESATIVAEAEPRSI